MFSLLRRGPGRLTPEQVRQQTGQGTSVLPYVRGTAERAAGPAPGALRLPLSRLAAGASLPAAAQGASVVAVCRSGHRSRRAAGLPAGRGVQAAVVTGGTAARARAGLPVTARGGNGGVIA
ncbi:rhodanese-like domain-containing protein [Streptomyces sp. NPDC017082]|uniref:rhodanese-like domain-containing protein n=1 Tax=Streptomyces sp. NPDC017082 TaxID=3364974 RepID=UPI0037A2ABCC